MSTLAAGNTRQEELAVQCLGDGGGDAPCKRNLDLGKDLMNYTNINNTPMCWAPTLGQKLSVPSERLNLNLCG